MLKQTELTDELQLRHLKMCKLQVSFEWRYFLEMEDPRKEDSLEQTASPFSDLIAFS